MSYPRYVMYVIFWRPSISWMDEGELFFSPIPRVWQEEITYEKSKRKGKRASENQFAIGYQSLFSSEVSSGYSNKIAVRRGDLCRGKIREQATTTVTANVSWKWCSRYFKLYHAYSISFNSWNVGEFFWSWILTPTVIAQFRRRKRGSLSVSSRTPHKPEIRQFHVHV